MRKFSLILAVALVASAGCKKDEQTAEDTEQAETEGTETAEGAETGEEEEVAEGEEGEEAEEPDMLNDMKHCPSAVEGATTKVEEADGAVVVTVTAKDKAAVKEIRSRAEHLASVSGADASEVEHTGEGTGGGALGKCPVALRDATAKSEEVKGGAKVTLTPDREGELGDLLETAKSRAEAMGGGEGEGGGEEAEEGGHGSGKGAGKGAGKGGKGAGKAVEGKKGGKKGGGTKAEAKEGGDEEGGW